MPFDICPTPRVRSTQNHGLWARMPKDASLALTDHRGDADTVGAVLSEDAWEPAVLSAQFLCETETALRKKCIKRLPHKKQVTLGSLYLTQCCRSVTRSCATLRGLMGCSPPGYSVLHSRPELS